MTLWIGAAIGALIGCLVWLVVSYDPHRIRPIIKYGATGTSVIWRPRFLTAIVLGAILGLLVGAAVR